MAGTRDFRIKMEGQEALVRTLKHASPRVAGRVMRGGVKEAVKPIVKKAKAGARKIKESGLLAKSIGSVVRTYKLSGNSIGLVGPRDDKSGEYQGKKRDPLKYMHLVEFGTKPHGSHPGTPAKGFMREAYSSGGKGAMKKLTDIVKRRLVKEMAKEAAKKK